MPLKKGKILTKDEQNNLREYYKTHSKDETAVFFGISTATVTKYKENKRILLNDEEKKKKNYLGVKSFRIRTKEKAVCDYIKINFPQFNIINDKKIKGGCSNRRPDIYIELDNQIIIIEIDEN